MHRIPGRNGLRHRQVGGLIDGKVWCEVCKRLERPRKDVYVSTVKVYGQNA